MSALEDYWCVNMEMEFDDFLIQWPYLTEADVEKMFADKLLESDSPLKPSTLLLYEELGVPAGAHACSKHTKFDDDGYPVVEFEVLDDEVFQDSQYDDPEDAHFQGPRIGVDEEDGYLLEARSNLLWCVRNRDLIAHIYVTLFQDCPPGMPSASPSIEVLDEDSSFKWLQSLVRPLWSPSQGPFPRIEGQDL